MLQISGILESNGQPVHSLVKDCLGGIDSGARLI